MDFSFLDLYDLRAWEWIAWIGFGLVTGLSKAGFSGFASVMTPVVATIFGARESTGLTLPLLCFADILVVFYYRRHAEWKYIIRLIPWTLAGFALALFVDTLIPVKAFRYLMGGSIIGGLIVMIWNERREKDKLPPSAWWFSALFGIAGGFASAVGNVAGPIMSVFLLSMRLPKNNFVGTTAWFFLIVNCLKFPIQIFVWKNLTLKTLMFDLTLVPVIVFAALLGVFLVKKIPENIYRKTILIFTFISTMLLFI